MAVVNGYTGWATGVNRVILDSTTITLGENAVKSDELDSGLRRSWLKGSYVPDKFAVVMEFDWLNEVEGRGKTEYQLYCEWYKYVHKYGSVPFEFPAILYSPMSGLLVIDSKSQPSRVEYYKITSSVEGAKSGEKVQVKMTWESVHGGVVSIPDTKDEVIGIDAHNGYFDINYSSVGSVSPTQAEFDVYIDSVPVSKTGFYYDGARTVRIWFAPFADSLEHTLTFSSSSSHLELEPGRFTDIFRREAS